MSEGMTSDPAAHECQLWTEERNTLAKAVMQDIEAQRKQRRAAR